MTIEMKIRVFEGGALGAERNIVPNAVFLGKRHDNKIIKVKMFIVEKFSWHCAGSYFGSIVVVCPRKETAKHRLH